MSTVRIGPLLPPWSYGFIVAFALWIVTISATGPSRAGGTLVATVAFAAFSVLVGTGQMLVIASGPGNIDLSIPSVMTLAAYLAMSAMHESDGLVFLGLAVALGVGVVAGALNYAAIALLRLPPIIATLAWSFVFQSFAIDFGGEATLKPPPVLAASTTFRAAGIPILPGAVVVLTLIVMVVLRRTVFGRSLLAAGQSERAAYLAGVEVGWVRLWAYALCGGLGALAGYLLAGFTGGAALNMGDIYLMESIAVVVLGGTSVAGGDANAIGIWGAALFFNLLGIMLNTFRFQAGVRLFLTGVLIIAIVALVPHARARA